MYMWLYRQLNAGTSRTQSAALSVGRSRKLKQLSSNWPDPNNVFVF